MKHGKKIIIVVAVIVIILALFLVKYLMDVHKYKTAVNNMAISDIDISKVPDGHYEGECDVDYIYAKVSVTIKNGAITELKLLKHRNERGAIAEKIIDNILAKQTIDVDTISGATNSSKVIKKAIENALIG
ncbi:FMN-binding protein [Oscillospiraceae bacterium PP1C4]